MTAETKGDSIRTHETSMKYCKRYQNKKCISSKKRHELLINSCHDKYEKNYIRENEIPKNIKFARKYNQPVQFPRGSLY